MDNVAGHLDKVNWKAVAVGAAVGGIAVATGKAVVEAGKYLAELGDDYNKAMNQLSASTGATGDELDALGESVKNIYAQNLGEDFNDVAEGLAATQKASDLAGEALEQATAAGFVLRDTFDYDIIDKTSNASVASGTFMQMNASDGPHYGANVKLDKAGAYKLVLKIESPEKKGWMLHVDPETGVKGRFWTEPIEVTFPDWNYTPQEW